MLPLVTLVTSFRFFPFFPLIFSPDLSLFTPTGEVKAYTFSTYLDPSRSSAGKLVGMGTSSTSELEAVRCSDEAWEAVAEITAENKHLAEKRYQILTDV